MPAMTINFPSEVKQSLDEFARREGVSSDDIIQQAVKQHLFLRQFRLLRERLSTRAAAMGVVTDQDVFDRVS
jgi:predicted transcriptional regulator